MTMTATSTNTQYRKTQQGEWVVFGPVANVHVGMVAVTKRDGSTKVEDIERVGKSFVVAGIECRYGYIARPSHGARSSHTTRCYYGHTSPVAGCSDCFDTFDF